MGDNGVAKESRSVKLITLTEIDHGVSDLKAEGALEITYSNAFILQVHNKK